MLCTAAGPRIEKAEAGALDRAAAAECEARIVALERLPGRQAFEIKPLKGAQRSGRSARSGSISGTAARAVSRSGGAVNRSSAWEPKACP